MSDLIQCARCLKRVANVDGEVHTCTPTPRWAALEAECAQWKHDACALMAINKTLTAGVERQAALEAECARLRTFFDKHALGPMLPPSCLSCGKSTQNIPVAIQHMELPGIVICTKCTNAAAAAGSE